MLAPDDRADWIETVISSRRVLRRAAAFETSDLSSRDLARLRVSAFATGWRVLVWDLREPRDPDEGREVLYVEMERDLPPEDDEPDPAPRDPMDAALTLMLAELAP